MPAMLDALTQLRQAVEMARPQAQAVIVDLQRLYDALKALLPKEQTDAVPEA